jgi:GT2 family glycosyltransferase/Flp pilus assembly protein TadD
VSLRVLLGCVNSSFVDNNLREAIASGTCIPFGTDIAAGQGIRLGSADNWESVCARLPSGWQPDVVAFELAYQTTPPWLGSVPVPVVGLAADAPLQFHWARRVLRRCELVLADLPTVQRLHQEGIRHARAANLFGLGHDFLDQPLPELNALRDIDILFIGNWHPAVQRQRLAWLGRLARLRSRWNVLLATKIYGDDYRALLARSRVVFNRSIRGECNRRVAECLWAGSLLFQESSNSEVPACLGDRRECIFYDDNLEQLLDYYLSHEDERRVIAEAGWTRLPEFGSQVLWQQAMAQVEAELPALRERMKNRPAWGGRELLLARAWQELGASDGGDASLAGDLQQALGHDPEEGALHNALGLVVAVRGTQGGRATVEQARQAAGHFRLAVACAPRDPILLLNLAEVLVGIGQTQLAIESAGKALVALERCQELSEDTLEAPHFPPAYDHFRVEWEHAAWDHPGDRHGEAQAKRSLLRWRLHHLLADLTGELVHFHEAVHARPDLPTSQAALGCALGRANRAVAAVEHLRQASQANPLDHEAARALWQALTDIGDDEGARRQARDHKLLAEAAPGRVLEENWFQQARPVGDELASLLILCCNEVAVTRLCLESVLRHTRTPYELILVDNGSTDATPAYLEEVARYPGPARVIVIRNQENQGFAKGCNQALAAAKGQYLVLLNNDTVVTPGWLDRLIAWSLHEWPKIGLVGPVTNYAPPPQLVEPAYTTLEELDPFAARRRREFAGQAIRVGRLTGFCLLLRREVLERLGKLDEQFGLGFFEDDDLCLRARQAGIELLVALDTYIHHFGSQTFKGLGIDTERALKENFALLQRKWGAEHTAGYRVPGGARPDIVPAPRSVPARSAEELFPGKTGGTVTLCMIVRNEQKNLADCLASILDLVDNAVINDTGSTDRTREIAASFGPKVKVVCSTWPDSFAAARNVALEHATGDWIFWMDADDRLDEENRQKLRALFASLRNENAAFTMKCFCVPDPQNPAGTFVDHIRLFRNHPEIRWEYRVHEQILPAVRRLGGEVRWADVVITHVGYADPALRNRKLQRDLHLLQLNLAEAPDEPFCLFNLGSILQEQGKYAEAIPALRRSLARSGPSDSIVRKLYALIASCHRALGQHKEALATFAEGRSVCPGDAELLFSEARLLADLGDFRAAEASCLELLATRPGQHFASVIPGLREFRGRELLATIYDRQQRHQEALAQWRLVTGEWPGYLPGWLGLADNALARSDWDALEHAAQQVERFPGCALHADLLRARGLTCRRDFAAARALLGRLIAEYPQQAEPRWHLSLVCLQDGSIAEAIEQALRDVLLVEPAHPQAQHNLSVLLRQRSRTEDAVFEAKGNVLAWVLAQRYETACLTPSDIHEHLPTLHTLACECGHVTELGTRSGISTLALLRAQPKKLICYDLVRLPEVDQLAALAGETEFIFRQEDVLLADIEETDLLFLDTWHVYQQLKAELLRHAAKARKYIVLHDTTTYGEKGETDGHKGLWPAVEEFLAEGTFRLKQRYENNNGLAVLERVGG